MRFTRSPCSPTGGFWPEANFAGPISAICFAWLPMARWIRLFIRARVALMTRFCLWTFNRLDKFWSADFSRPMIRSSRRGGFARLHSDGTLDAAFGKAKARTELCTPFPNNPTRMLVVGGGFQTYDGKAANFLARLFRRRLDRLFCAGVFQYWKMLPRRQSQCGGSATPVLWSQVNFSVSNLSALAGLDYVSTNGGLTFSAGATQRVFSVALLAGARSGGNKTFAAQVNQPSTGAVLGSNQFATVVMVETNLPGRIEFAASGGGRAGKHWSSDGLW